MNTSSLKVLVGQIVAVLGGVATATGVADPQSVATIGQNLVTVAGAVATIVGVVSTLIAHHNAVKAAQAPANPTAAQSVVVPFNPSKE